jgi:hypothetical protein
MHFRIFGYPVWLLQRIEQTLDAGRISAAVSNTMFYRASIPATIMEINVHVDPFT